MTILLPAVEIEPPHPADACVIWLHGLGADGHDFEGLVPELRLPADHAIRFILPHAPSRAVTLNGGKVMPAWFDLYGLSAGAREDAAGLEQARDMLTVLIERERSRGVAARRIVLAGFSQGGAVALHTGLRHPERLAGIMALSTYLPLAGRLDDAAAANRDIPIFMAHGRVDQVVELSLARASHAALAAAGYQVIWREYPMRHSVCAEEVMDIRAWLMNCLLS
jgi:phospholipase/carboxylesterase